MRVIDCPVCRSRVNALVHHCPECGADPRLPRAEAEADLRARGIPLPGDEEPAPSARRGTPPASVIGAPSASVIGAPPSPGAAVLSALPPPAAAPPLLPVAEPGPAAWPAVLGAAFFTYWGLVALPRWLALAFIIVYPLFVRTAEHRRCRELALGLDGGLHLLLGIAAGALWATLPSGLGASLLDTGVMVYTQLADGALVRLALTAGVFVPLLFGLVFRYAEHWAGSGWALVVVTVVYVLLGLTDEQDVTLLGVAWTAFAALVYALSYLLTRRLWLPVGLRIGMALFATPAPVFSLDVVRVAGLEHAEADAILHLGFLSAATLVMLAAALRRGALVGRGRGWQAQTGRPLPPLGLADAGFTPAPRAGLWAALGCAAVLDAVYWLTGHPWSWVALAIPLAYWAYVRRVERRPCAELAGVPGAASLAITLGLAAGFLLGLASWLPDDGPFAGSTLVSPVWLSAGLIAGTLFWALSEEVIWRGLLQRSIEHRVGSIWALLVVSVAFAAWHLRWNPVAFFDVALAGALFGSAFLLTRRVWLSAGIHAGWNLAVWGWTGAVYRSGLAFLLVLALQSAAITLMLLLARRRGRLVPRPPRRGHAMGPALHPSPAGTGPAAFPPPLVMPPPIPPAPPPPAMGPPPAPPPGASLAPPVPQSPQRPTL